MRARRTPRALLIAVCELTDYGNVDDCITGVAAGICHWGVGYNKGPTEDFSYSHISGPRRNDGIQRCHEEDVRADTAAQVVLVRRHYSKCVVVASQQTSHVKSCLQRAFPPIVDLGKLCVRGDIALVNFVTCRLSISRLVHIRRQKVVSVKTVPAIEPPPVSIGGSQNSCSELD